MDPAKKTLNLNLGLNFISIHCETVAEAQKRALLVAVLSYNLKRRSFIHLFTQSTIGDGLCLKSLFAIWTHYDINEPAATARMQGLINSNIMLTETQKTAIMLSVTEVRELRERQKKQGHGGFVITEGSRWEYEELTKLKFDKVESKKPYTVGGG